MIETYLYRIFDDDEGTVGLFLAPAFSWQCFVNELPDRNNERNYGRINKGRYLTKWHNSPRFGYVPLLYDVENRSGILIHSGNYAGDTVKKYKTDSLGCLLMGDKIANMNGQRAVLNSKSTMYNFSRIMDKKDFYININ